MSGEWRTGSTGHRFEEKWRVIWTMMEEECVGLYGSWDCSGNGNVCIGIVAIQVVGPRGRDLEPSRRHHDASSCPGATGNIRNHRRHGFRNVGNSGSFSDGLHIFNLYRLWMHPSYPTVQTWRLWSFCEDPHFENILILINFFLMIWNNCWWT